MFLILTLFGREWLISCPNCFTSEKSPCYRLKLGDDVPNRWSKTLWRTEKYLATVRNRTSFSLSSPHLSHYTHYTGPAWYEGNKTEVETYIHDWPSIKCLSRHKYVQSWFLEGLYSSPNIMRVIKSRRMRWAGHVAHMGEGRGVYRVLVGKPEGKRPLGRPRHRWEDNIRMDLQEVGVGYEDWIGLALDRDRWRALVSAVRNLRVP